MSAEQARRRPTASSRADRSGAVPTVAEPSTEPTRPGAAGRAAGRAARGRPGPVTSRGRPGRGGRAGWPPAPARSRSTPSAPPATGTASAPTSCSCAAPGAGTVLIDPVALPDLVHRWTPRSRTPSGCCTRPARTCPAWPRSACARRRLFDTELAGRLLGYERVGLGADGREPARARPGEGPLGRRLVDPAAAPSPGCATPRSTSRCWSSCATLLEAAAARSRASWSGPRQEFAAVRRRPAAGAAGRPLAADLRHPPGARPPGARDRPGAVGGRATRSPGSATSPRGRVLPDTAIVAAALAHPDDGRGARRRSRCSPAAATAPAPRAGYGAVDAAAARCRRPTCRRPRCPATARRRPSRWADRDPAAAARLAAARAALGRAVRAARIPVENLLSPDAGPPALPGRRRRTPTRPRRRRAAGRRRPPVAGRARRGAPRGCGDSATAQRSYRRVASALSRRHDPLALRDVVFVDGARTPFGKAGPKGMYARDPRRRPGRRGHPRAAAPAPRAAAGADRRGRDRRHHPDRRPGPDHRPHAGDPGRAADAACRASRSTGCAPAR